MTHLAGGGIKRHGLEMGFQKQQVAGARERKGLGRYALLGLWLAGMVCAATVFAGEGGRFGGWVPKERLPLPNGWKDAPPWSPREPRFPIAPQGSVHTAWSSLIQLQEKNRKFKVHSEFGKREKDRSTWTSVTAGPFEGQLLFYDRFRKAFEIRSVSALGVETRVHQQSDDSWDFDLIEVGMESPGEGREWIGYRHETGQASLFVWAGVRGEIREKIRLGQMSKGCTSFASGKFGGPNAPIQWACYQSPEGRIELMEENRLAWSLRSRYRTFPNSEYLLSGRWAGAEKGDLLLLYNSDMARIRVLDLPAVRISGRLSIAPVLQVMDARELGARILPPLGSPLVRVGSWSNGALERSELLIYDRDSGATRLFGHRRSTNQQPAFEFIHQWLLPAGAHALNSLKLVGLDLPQPAVDRGLLRRSVSTIGNLRSKEGIGSLFFEAFVLHPQKTEQQRKPAAMIGTIPSPGLPGFDPEVIQDRFAPEFRVPQAIHLFRNSVNIKVNTVLLGNDGAHFPYIWGAPSRESGFARAAISGRGGRYSLSRQMERMSRDFHPAGIRFSLDQQILLRSTKLAELPVRIDPSWSEAERAEYYRSMDQLERYAGWMGSPPCLRCVEENARLRLRSSCQWGVPSAGVTSCDSFAEDVCRVSCPQRANADAYRSGENLSPAPTERLVQFVRRSEGGTGSSSWGTWGFMTMTDESIEHPYFGSHEGGHYLGLHHSHLEPLERVANPNERRQRVAFDLGAIPHGYLYSDATMGLLDPEEGAPRPAPLDSYCDDEALFQITDLGNCLWAHRGAGCSKMSCELCVTAVRPECATQWNASCVEIASDQTRVDSCAYSSCAVESSVSLSFIPPQTNVMAYGYGQCIEQLGVARGFSPDQAWRMRRWLWIERPDLIRGGLGDAPNVFGNFW